MDGEVRSKPLIWGDGDLASGAEIWTQPLEGEAGT